MTRNKNKLPKDHSKTKKKKNLFEWKSSLTDLTLKYSMTFIYLHKFYDIQNSALNISAKGLFFVFVNDHSLTSLS